MFLCEKTTKYEEKTRTKSAKKGISGTFLVVLQTCMSSHFSSFLDLPRRSYKLTDVRVSVRLLPAFLGISSLVFSDFWHKDAKWQCPKCDGARFSKKIHFRPKMPEICRKNRFFGIFSGRKCRKYARNRRVFRFSLDFFLIFLVFFFT